MRWNNLPNPRIAHRIVDRIICKLHIYIYTYAVNLCNIQYRKYREHSHHHSVYGIRALVLRTQKSIQPRNPHNHIPHVRWWRPKASWPKQELKLFQDLRTIGELQSSTFSPSLRSTRHHPRFTIADGRQLHNMGAVNEHGTYYKNKKGFVDGTLKRLTHNPDEQQQWNR